MSVCFSTEDLMRLVFPGKIDKQNFITDIKVIVPEKVVEISFLDGKKEKMVCSNEDKFDLEWCCYLALSKHFYRNDMTVEGIEYLAGILPFYKDWAKCVRNALKDYEQREKLKAELEADKKEKERIAERKRQKKIAYKQRKAEREREQLEAEREEMISIIAEAVKIANK